ncbi:hypothetical protein [Thalassospira sp. GB04J01]|uniref:hypothetical protein n=1 Tax=Thalassospira sp. GB04J01 TaxID=1485225 RepID=UPI0004724F65|nr:hypothetical protein [Thalassospira sp. GB04J01]
MKKGKLSAVVFGSLLLIIAIFIYTQEKEKEDNVHISQLSEEEQIELEYYIESLQKEGGFFDQVGEELRKVGYSYQTVGMINSKNDIRLIIVIPDNEVVTEQKKVGVKKIYQDMIIKLNMNLKAFKIQVGHIDDLSW